MKNLVQIEMKKSWSFSEPFEIIFVGDFDEFIKKEIKEVGYSSVWYNTDLRKVANPYTITYQNGEIEESKRQYKLTQLTKELDEWL